MKKIISLSILISTIFFLLSASNTYAIYMAADNGLEAAYEENLSQMTEASKYINNTEIIIKADLSSASYTFRIVQGRVDTLYSGGTVNSGDPSVSAAFFAYAFTSFPADNEIAVLWDHGNGWEDVKSERKSIFYDAHPYDNISVITGEFKEILSRVKSQTGRKIDMLVFDACAMQCSEVLYDISDYAEYSAGSPLIIPFYGLPYLDILTEADTASSVEEIGRIICRDFYNEYSVSRDSLSFSLIKLSSLKEVVRRFEPSTPSTFMRISGSEVMIKDSTRKTLVYEQGSIDEFHGVKIFYPESYSLFAEKYGDYRKLTIDGELDIMKREFSVYGVADTLPPLTEGALSIDPDGYWNYRIESKTAYDLSGVAEYNAYFGNRAVEDKESFSDSSENPMAGSYSYTSYSFISPPFSIFVNYADTVISIDDEFAVIGLGVLGRLKDSGISIINNEDTLRTITGRYDTWKSFYFPVKKGKVRIEYFRNGDDFLYLDDISLTRSDNIRKESSQRSNFLIHKVKSGRNMLLLTATDIFGNESSGDSLCYFTSEDSLGISLYPNPASDYINIVTEYNGKYEARIFSADGGNSFIAEGFKTSGYISIDLRGFPIERGMHYIIINIEGKILKGKFLKI